MTGKAKGKLGVHVKVTRVDAATTSSSRDAWAKHARMAVILGGVPETVVLRAEKYGEVDWRPLAGETDGLSMAGGHLDLKRFWRTPHPDLAGRTPLDALDGPAAARRVAGLVRDRTWAINRARVGV